MGCRDTTLLIDRTLQRSVRPNEMNPSTKSLGQQTSSDKAVSKRPNLRPLPLPRGLLSYYHDQQKHGAEQPRPSVFGSRVTAISIALRKKK